MERYELLTGYPIAYAAVLPKFEHDLQRAIAIGIFLLAVAFLVELYFCVCDESKFWNDSISDIL